MTEANEKISQEIANAIESYISDRNKGEIRDEIVAAVQEGFMLVNVTAKSGVRLDIFSAAHKPSVYSVALCGYTKVHIYLRQDESAWEVTIIEAIKPECHPNRVVGISNSRQQAIRRAMRGFIALHFTP
jgi:hypothetical protein